MSYKFRKLKSYCNLKLLVLLTFLFIIFKLFFASDNLQPRTRNIENKSSETLRECFLVVLILTGSKNVEQRTVIRETWLSDYKNSVDVCYYFAIGTKGIHNSQFNAILDEQKLNNDLLILDSFQDAYEKLTEKLALSLQWLNSNVDFNFIFKGDDDTFARIDVILSELKTDTSKHNTDNLYWGYFYGKANVKRSGQWKETKWKLCDHYLPYARGGGYILSHKLVKFISNNWLDFEMYLSEDVTVGAWLAPLKLTRIHDVRFDTEYKSRGCKNQFIVSHKQSIEEIRTKHKNLQKNGNLCAVEVVNFHGYQYDWDSFPSKCCVRSESFP